MPPPQLFFRAAQTASAGRHRAPGVPRAACLFAAFPAGSLHVLVRRGRATLPPRVLQSVAHRPALLLRYIVSVGESELTVISSRRRNNISCMSLAEERERKVTLGQSDAICSMLPPRFSISQSTHRQGIFPHCPIIS
jgi:hypothetical protein